MVPDTELLNLLEFPREGGDDRSTFCSSGEEAWRRLDSFRTVAGRQKHQALTRSSGLSAPAFVLRGGGGGAGDS